MRAVLSILRRHTPWAAYAPGSTPAPCRLDTASGQGTGNGHTRPMMPIADPSSNEQGSRRDHDSRDKRGQAGNQQKVLQDSGHDSLPDPLLWRSDLAE